LKINISALVQDTEISPFLGARGSNPKKRKIERKKSLGYIEYSYVNGRKVQIS